MSVVVSAKRFKRSVESTEDGEGGAFDEDELRGPPGPVGPRGPKGDPGPRGANGLITEGDDAIVGDITYKGDITPDETNTTATIQAITGSFTNLSVTSTIEGSIDGNAATATDLASGSVLAVSKGGTGATSASDAKTNLNLSSNSFVEFGNIQLSTSSYTPVVAKSTNGLGLKSVVFSCLDYDADLSDSNQCALFKASLQESDNTGYLFWGGYGASTTDGSGGTATFTVEEDGTISAKTLTVTNAISGSITGNAATATDLASGSVLAVTKGGTGNSTLDGAGIVTKTGDQTIAGDKTFTGAVSADGGLYGSVIGNVTGNADTATALATARTIGGVSFNGTQNINLPGVNTAGTQDTSGNAATATALETARTIGGVSFDGTADITEFGDLTASKLTVAKDSIPLISKVSHSLGLSSGILVCQDRDGNLNTNSTYQSSLIKASFQESDNTGFLYWGGYGANTSSGTGGTATFSVGANGNVTCGSLYGPQDADMKYRSDAGHWFYLDNDDDGDHAFAVFSSNAGATGEEKIFQIAADGTGNFMRGPLKIDGPSDDFIQIFAGLNVEDNGARTYRGGVMVHNHETYGAFDMSFCVARDTGIANKNKIVSADDIALTLKRASKSTHFFGDGISAFCRNDTSAQCFDVSFPRSRSTSERSSTLRLGIPYGTETNLTGCYIQSGASAEGKSSLLIGQVDNGVDAEFNIKVGTDGILSLQGTDNAVIVKSNLKLQGYLLGTAGALPIGAAAMYRLIDGTVETMGANWGQGNSLKRVATGAVNPTTSMKLNGITHSDIMTVGMDSNGVVELKLANSTYNGIYQIKLSIEVAYTSTALVDRHIMAIKAYPYGYNTDSDLIGHFIDMDYSRETYAAHINLQLDFMVDLNTTAYFNFLTYADSQNSDMSNPVESSTNSLETTRYRVYNLYISWEYKGTS
jgi:hypothetical protein